MVTINIDGNSFQVDKNQNVLEAAKQCGIEIPSLCDIDTFTDECALCDVEIAGKGIVKACKVKPTDGMVVTTSSQLLSNIRKCNLERILQRANTNCSVPPCQIACPANVDIQSYLYFIANNEHLKAIEVIKKTLPMPLSIGRVCPAFCEAKCQRNLVDEPLAIRQLKRYAADIDLEKLNSYTPIKKDNKGIRIAIVGAGPGGLSCGYFLSNEGYNVTVYEAMPQAGGWLRYGIPEYRLPKDILDKEIDIMCRNGMSIETNKKLGENFTLSSLREEFDAVCLAIGASQASEMKYTGSDLAGCYLGVDFLKDQTLDKQYTIGKKVAVIGGGNTAIDCARSALRLGADTTLIYRRTRDEMPAETYEIEEAEHEGVKFHFLTNPAENIADDNGHVCQIKLEKMALGEPDASGRCSPKATGEYFVEDFDTVIAAVSQKTDTSFIATEDIELSFSRWNTINVDETTMHSGVKNIFAIGDFRRGPATAIEAIADGRKAAKGIDEFFGGTMEKLYTESFRSRNVERSHLIQPEHIEKLKRVMASIATGDNAKQTEEMLNHALAKVLRAKMPELTLAQRHLSFNEVETGLSQQAAIDEAKRCLSCGCDEGNDCKLRQYATDYKVDRKLFINRAVHLAN
ncbi:FAD-dependent oxidoreductase [Photobacterium angustum]|uniref:NADPH-dependent glutamate synthase small subunit n=1 Tax=Photobacterium angustum TaxID=661 RepID=A0A855SFH8_PHOAN|nr:FAD-dependent oxidoreductase [Photobacterium angustum]KJF83294.1 NADH-ubiquinone oxidoreductase [Photobacterium damselae subsp. damselae]KJF93792.1 NADH-ubiquinone oxidoreductase [Photobacterium angustum]KJG08124.1 NADH-ubiquinone oxidoreductase [Photobacterium angustum]KJG42856.1 NADH-ubiquinone oxidoreductase [Photobacterium angustum]KJG47602.1 NADH-ubiquinone oxidoreductase [Photobacterium angustum]